MTSFKPRHVSFSSLQLYDNCPRCYFLQYGMGCRSEEKEAWRFGSGYHAGLAAYYGGFDFWDGFREELGALASRYEKAAKVMFDYYLLFGDKYTASKIEHKFETQLVNPLTKEVLILPIKGVIDLITEESDIVDHKTSSFEYGAEEKTDPQLLIYSMVHRKLMGGPARKLIFSVHRKDKKAGMWQAVEKDPDEIAEAILFLEIKEKVKKILAGEFEPKQTGGWFFTHFPVCPMYAPRRRKSH